MEAVHLPLWIEYVKALGTPIVAMVAGCIAGGIAYRQWSTARNKLKLDMFDRRMKVYQDAVSLIAGIAYPEPMEWEKVAELSASFASARWLINAEIAAYLDSLAQRGCETIVKSKLDVEGIAEEDKLNFVFNEMAKAKIILDKEMLKLNRLFEPYLALRH